MPLPGRRHAFRVQRHRTGVAAGRTTAETAYGLAPLGPARAGPSEILALNSGNWEIENRLHHVRDVSCDEDRSRVRVRHLPRKLARLSNATISIVRTHGVFRHLPRARRRYAARHMDALREVLRPRPWRAAAGSPAGTWTDSARGRRPSSEVRRTPEAAPVHLPEAPRCTHPGHAPPSPPQSPRPNPATVRSRPTTE